MMNLLSYNRIRG